MKKRKRQLKVIERLESQLNLGVKTEKHSSTGQKKEVQIPLTEGDVKRIKSEIEILKKRV